MSETPPEMKAMFGGKRGGGFSGVVMAMRLAVRQRGCNATDWLPTTGVTSRSR
jgi:hypothetical protein